MVLHKFGGNEKWFSKGYEITNSQYGEKVVKLDRYSIPYIIPNNCRSKWERHVYKAKSRKK